MIEFLLDEPYWDRVEKQVDKALEKDPELKIVAQLKDQPIDYVMDFLIASVIKKKIVTNSIQMTRSEAIDFLNSRLPEVKSYFMIENESLLSNVAFFTNDTETLYERLKQLKSENDLERHLEFMHSLFKVQYTLWPDSESQ